MLIVKKLSLDMMNWSTPQIVEVVQNDVHTRRVDISLFAGSQPWQLEDGVTCSVAFKKPDGTSGWYDTLPDGAAAVTVDKNTVQALLAAQMLTVPGNVAATIVFQNAQLDRLSTFHFIVKVAPDPAGGVAISNNYYRLQNLEQVNTAVDELQQQLDALIKVDDVVISLDSSWSSKNIVDKLCPSFTKSGSVVTCEPVEGYPLEVVVQGVSNPNLIPSDAEWPIDEIYDAPACEIGYLPSGVYTVYSNVDSIDVQAYDATTDEWITVLPAPNSANSAQTFEHIGGVLRVVDLDFNITSEDFFVKLEAGTQYTGTNYTKPTLTHTGKNVFGGNALVDELKSQDKGGVKVNEVEKTVTFDPGGMTTDIIFSKFKENTQYTIILYGHNTLGITQTNIYVKYTDGTQGYPRFKEVTENHYVIFKSNKAKTVSFVKVIWENGKTVLCYDQCGVFEGDVSVEKFEAYRAETLSLGEPIPAFPGVNTLWADTGDITVKGKADPAAIFADLYEKINQLQAIAVNNA